MWFFFEQIYMYLFIKHDIPQQKFLKKYYLLIRFPQTKITLLIFFNNRVRQKSKPFLLSKPYSILDNFNAVKSFDNLSKLSLIYPSFALFDIFFQCRVKNLPETSLKTGNEAPLRSRLLVLPVKSCCFYHIS